MLFQKKKVLSFKDSSQKFQKIKNYFQIIQKAFKFFDYSS